MANANNGMIKNSKILKAGEAIEQLNEDLVKDVFNAYSPSNSKRGGASFADFINFKFFGIIPENRSGDFEALELKGQKVPASVKSDIANIEKICKKSGDTQPDYGAELVKGDDGKFKVNYPFELIFEEPDWVVDTSAKLFDNTKCSIVLNNILTKIVNHRGGLVKSELEKYKTVDDFVDSVIKEYNKNLSSGKKVGKKVSKEMFVSHFYHNTIIGILKFTENIESKRTNISSANMMIASSENAMKRLQRATAKTTTEEFEKETNISINEKEKYKKTQTTTHNSQFKGFRASGKSVGQRTESELSEAQKFFKESKLKNETSEELSEEEQTNVFADYFKNKYKQKQIVEEMKKAGSTISRDIQGFEQQESELKNHIASQVHKQYEKKHKEIQQLETQKDKIEYEKYATNFSTDKDKEVGDAIKGTWLGGENQEEAQSAKTLASDKLVSCMLIDDNDNVLNTIVNVSPKHIKQIFGKSLDKASRVVFMNVVDKATSKPSPLTKEMVDLCKNATSVELQYNVTEIDDYAFARQNIKQVVLQSAPKKLRENALKSDKYAYKNFDENGNFHWNLKPETLANREPFTAPDTNPDFRIFIAGNKNPDKYVGLSYDSFMYEYSNGYLQNDVDGKIYTAEERVSNNEKVNFLNFKDAIMSGEQVYSFTNEQLKKRVMGENGFASGVRDADGSGETADKDAEPKTTSDSSQDVSDQTTPSENQTTDEQQGNEEQNVDDNTGEIVEDPHHTGGGERFSEPIRLDEDEKNDNEETKEEDGKTEGESDEKEEELTPQDPPKKKTSSKNTTPEQVKEGTKYKYPHCLDNHRHLNFGFGALTRWAIKRPVWTALALTGSVLGVAGMLSGVVPAFAGLFTSIKMVAVSAVAVGVIVGGVIEGTKQILKRTSRRYRTLFMTDKANKVNKKIQEQLVAVEQNLKDQQRHMITETQIMDGNVERKLSDENIKDIKKEHNEFVKLARENEKLLNGKKGVNALYKEMDKYMREVSRLEGQIGDENQAKKETREANQEIVKKIVRSYNDSVKDMKKVYGKDEYYQDKKVSNMNVMDYYREKFAEDKNNQPQENKNSQAQDVVLKKEEVNRLTKDILVRLNNTLADTIVFENKKDYKEKVLANRPQKPQKPEKSDEEKTKKSKQKASKNNDKDAKDNEKDAKDNEKDTKKEAKKVVVPQPTDAKADKKKQDKPASNGDDKEQGR